MKSYIRLQLASILGSIFDFSFTWLWVNEFHAGYVAASIAGNVIGGVVLFMLCRNWVFRKYSGEIPFQAAKFIIVFAGSIVLTALGVFFLTHYLGVHYMLSKIGCSLLLGLSYNYILQSRWVFV